jgi:hypothetical protein
VPGRASAWEAAGLKAISAIEMAEAPDGSGETIPQWHLSVSVLSRTRRARGHEVRQALRDFGLEGAEEDNHEPGAARHFWMPVDPGRRVDCECKTTEEVVVEPDGHRWSRPRL